MKHYRIIKIKFVPCTDKKPNRVAIHCPRHNQKRIIPFNHDFNNALDVGLHFLKKLGITPKAFSEQKEFYAVMIDNFSTKIK